MNYKIKEFGKRVREIRLKKGLSQGDVAKILKVHRTYISGIERGLRNPSLITMEKIAFALDINIKKLL